MTLPRYPTSLKTYVSENEGEKEINSERGTCLLNFYSEIFQETSDLTIIAEGKKIFVHREILSSKSEYFQVFLQEHWVKKDEK